MKFLVGLLLIVSSIHGMAKARPATEVVASQQIGVSTISYEDPTRGRPVIIEVWYPTATVQGTLDQPQDLDMGWVHPKAIRNAELPEGKLPLIMVSHGNGGDRRDMSWLAERLVQKGYIVAAVEHHGNSSAYYDAKTSLRFWDRSIDISFALTKILEDSSLKNKIDQDRIGMIGYSLGGMTGLSIAGAEAKNAKEIALQVQKYRKELNTEIIESTDFEPSKKNYRDPRIKAVALFCPATFVYPNESLKSVKVPVALVASEGDEVVSFKDHSLRLISNGIPSKLKVLRDKVSHYVFLNRVSEAGKQLFCKEVQTESLHAHRLKFHNEIALFVTDFFEERLH